MTRRRRLRRWLLFLVLLWAGPLAVLLWFENALVYRPTRELFAPPAGDVRDVWLASADGTRLHGWWLPHPDPAGAAVVAHGNGGNLSHRGPMAAELRDRLRLSVLLFDYPGYGRSDGSPSEVGCYHAGDAAYLWVTEAEKFPGERVLLVGESLGGGVATDLAQRHPNRGLVLAKTFTSLPAVAKRQFPWLPTHLLMANRFDNRFKIARLTTPVFIAHGTADDLVPFAHAEELYAAANPPKRLFRLEGQDHNAWLPAAFYEELGRFLAENPLR
jgi:pimeloyl-ACP methyl ester carboxylesterase